MPAPDPNAERDKAARQAVHAVYRELAERPAERSCTLQTECCRFKLTGEMPYLTRGEAMVIAHALRAAGRKALPPQVDGACPLLDPRTARCIVYKDRPFGCRTHFCDAAGGPYARREVLDLIRQLEVIDTAVGGDGPRKLIGALNEVIP